MTRWYAKMIQPRGGLIIETYYESISELRRIK